MRLRAALDGIVDRSPRSTCLTVSAGGRTIYEHNADQSLTPASAEKLVTATVLLNQLGPDRRLTTSLVTTAPVVDGEVRGDVYLVGGGDPILETGDYADHFTNQPQLRTPAREPGQSAVAKVHRITGRLLGDESRFDTERYVPTWPPRFKAQNQSGPLSALTVNDNFSDFPPQETVGSLRTAAADPPVAAVQKLDELLDTRGLRLEGGTGAGRGPGRRQGPGPRRLAADARPARTDAHRERQPDGGDAPEGARPGRRAPAGPPRRGWR